MSLNNTSTTLTFQYLIKTILTMLAITFFLNSKAQQITGIVTDNQQHTLDSISVTLLRESGMAVLQSTTTNVNGSFQFTKLQHGRYYIRIHHLFFRDTTLQVNSQSAAHPEPLLIKLVPVVNTLKEVTVKYRKPTFEKKLDRFVFDVQQTGITTGNDSWSVLKGTPMINADNGGNLSISGIQGVTVYINERKVNLSGNDLYQYLKTTPADNIEKVEIITIPSGKYQAGNSGGIINIVMKKNQLEGFNVVATLSDQQATYNSQNASAQLTYKKKKLNALVTVNAASTNLHVSTDNSIHYLEPAEDEKLVTQLDTKPQRNLGLTAELDYDLTASARISFQSDYRNTHVNRFNTAIDQIFKTGDDLQTLQSESPFQESRNLLNNNIYYEFIDKKNSSKLTINADYLYYKSDNHSTFLAYDQDSLDVVYSGIQNGSTQLIKNYGVQADYDKKVLKKMDFEAGLRFSGTNSNNDYSYKSFVENNWVANPLYSDRFIYREKIIAGYALLQSSFGKKWSAMAGLRVENTRLDNSSFSTGGNYRQNYLNFFPSVYVDFKPGENHAFSFAVKSDINRPGYSQLNPFTYVLGDKYFVSGNPALRPSNTLLAELSYIYHDNYTFVLGYNHSSHLIGQLPNVHRPDTIFLERFNYGNSDNLHLTNVINQTVIKNVWIFNLTNTFSYQYQNVATTVFTGKTHNYFYSGNLNQTFPGIFKSKLDLSVNSNYYTAQKYANTKVSAYGDLNIGLSRKFPAQAMVISLYGADLLNTQKLKTFNIDGYNYRSSLKTFNDSRSVRISIVKRFGNGKLKSMKKRDTENSNEINRTK
ncbi:TonB-dependent receptor [Mucilaginibacter sp. CAU 1740]|uniref:TonB-dependent receptor n=1 Tax=Mucilaginibacter sp. CAU 1740 TaxID=3140365 RepID=UPI00325A8BE5